jgi:hypothetical protein
MKSCPHDIHSIVISLLYLNDGRRFIAGYASAIIRIYDESKLDDCSTIRTFELNVFEPELNLMDYCSLDRSILTTSAQGQSLKIWDSDTGKLDSEIEVCQTNGVIVAMTVLEPFPLILTSDSLGYLTIWGSRGCKWKGNQITSFANINPLTAEYEEQKKADANGIPPQRIYIKDEFRPTHQLRHQLTTIVSLSPMAGDGGGGGDGDGDAPFEEYDIRRRQHQLGDDFKRCEEKWGKVSAAMTVTWDKDVYDLYTGDELGYIRKWSLKQVIDELGGVAMMHGHKFVEVVPSRTRKGPRSGNAITPFHSNQINYMMGRYGNIAESAVKFRWALQGHNETVISCILSANGILTSSTDSLVKMWTFDGLLVGVLLHNILTGLKSIHWNISIDLNAVRNKEEQELDELMNQLHDQREEKKREFEQQQVENENKGGVRRGEGEGDNETENAVAEAKFSRSTLRKRIELSSKLLGLDFTNDIQQLHQPQHHHQQQQQQHQHHHQGSRPSQLSHPHTASPSPTHSYSEDTISEYGGGSVGGGHGGTLSPWGGGFKSSLPHEDDNISLSSSMSSNTMISKSTKDAIDESKNIFRQTGLVVKKKSYSVAQLRRSEQTMQRMAEKYLEKGIHLPLLTSMPKATEFLPVTSVSSASATSRKKIHTGKGRRKYTSIESRSAHELNAELSTQHLIETKCSKYSSYGNLENSLHSTASGVDGNLSLSAPLSAKGSMGQQSSSLSTTDKITERLRQRQQKMIAKIQIEKKALLMEMKKTKANSSVSVTTEGSEASGGGGTGGVTGRRVSKIDSLN